MATASTLGRLRCIDSAGEIGHLAISDSNENVRLNAVVALGEFPSAIVKPFLAHAVHDRNPDVARFAADELAALK
jgi:HEAT repeat protein